MKNIRRYLGASTWCVYVCVCGGGICVYVYMCMEEYTHINTDIGSSVLLSSLPVSSISSVSSLPVSSISSVSSLPLCLLSSPLSPLFPSLTFSTLASPAPSPPLPPVPAPPAALPRRWPRHMSQAWAATTIVRLVHMPRYSVMIGSSTGVCLTTRDPRRGYTLTICTTTFTVAPVATTQLCRFCINVPASVYLVGVAQTDERDVIVLCVSNTDMGFVQTAHTVECNATLVHMRCTTSH